MLALRPVPSLTSSSPGLAARTRRLVGHAPSGAPAAQHARRGPSRAPGLRATRDSGHRTMPRSDPGYATIALARCPLGPDAGSVENSHHPSSEGTFRVAALETTSNSPMDWGLVWGCASLLHRPPRP